MSKKIEKSPREARLAAALRANLGRRKAPKRAAADSAQTPKGSATKTAREGATGKDKPAHG